MKNMCLARVLVYTIFAKPTKSYFSFTSQQPTKSMITLRFKMFSDRLSKERRVHKMTQQNTYKTSKTCIYSYAFLNSYTCIYV